MIKFNDIIAQYKDKHLKVFVASTGAGAGITNSLWSVPGASEWLMGTAFPYSAHEFNKFIGYDKAKEYASQEGAIELAMSAYIRACESIFVKKPLLTDEQPVGLGLSAAVSTNRDRKGQNVVYIAVCHKMGINVAFAHIPNGTGEHSRSRDGLIVDQLALNAISNVFGLPEVAVDVSSFEVNEINDISGNKINWHVADNSRMAFSIGTVELYPVQQAEQFFKRPFYTAYETKTADNIGPNVILMPGTFNPIHDGHRTAMFKCSEITGKKVVYTITSDSRHKPPLTVSEMLEKVALMRLERFGHYPSNGILFTQGDPLYIDKARQKPGTAFLIGVDALERMLDPKWGVSVNDILHEFRTLGTKFYVGGRIVDGIKKTLTDMKIPATFDDMFLELPNTASNHSSTEIRKEIKCAT